MVNTLSRVFTALDTRRMSDNSPSKIPMLNTFIRLTDGFFAQNRTIFKKKDLMAWYKRTPELNSLVNKVARDIVKDWYFCSLDYKSENRNKLLKANTFSQEVFLRRIMYSQAVDILVSGEGYGWIGKLNETQIKDKIKELLNREVFIQSKEKLMLINRVYDSFKDTNSLHSTDEDFLSPKKYRYVASSTMENIHDQYNITGYKQWVASNYNNFSLKDIIRYVFMDVDGKVDGFTPVESVITQLELLRSMWQNMLSIYKNGGSPDKVFILKNLSPSSPAYKRIEQQLEKYRLVENQHGNMLFTGDVDIKDLAQLENMQFKDMGLYITGLMAMQWSIPRSSIPFIVDGANTKDDTGGNSERGYWENIEFAQDMFADIMNTQLWIPYFGVQIKFKKSFINKDVQHQTAKNWEFNNLQLMDNILRTHGKQLKKEFIQSKFGITEFDIEESTQEFQNPMIGMNNQSSSSEREDSDDKKNIKKVKKDEQISSNNSRGKPTGVGKEWDSKTDLEFKEMIGQDVQLLDLKNFVKVYNQDMSYNSGMPPRIFVRENSDFITYKFKSSDFVIKTILPIDNAYSDEVRILMMNLGNNFYYVQ